ncbi:M15 family metallopeptidase [Synechocystis sp. LKSZ1]|uniref:M15 family metallopeptidase n=1 Tax=Synechocystis sp. LKSZ1 TaxID=3144951 RepID=UPI00336BDD45
MLKPYRTVPIQDCGEPLLPIDLSTIALTDPPPYLQLGADYQGQSPYVLRQGVLQALARAQTHLSQQAPGWKLLIFDAYRPLAVQQFMVDYTLAQLQQAKGLGSRALSPQERQQLLQEVYQVWAMPSPDSATPPPHSTGAAIDLTLMDAQGQIVDMGGDIDELSPRSLPDYYANSPDPQALAYQQHRNLLNQAMEAAGFLRHPEEWWHFSLGDQLWAWLYNQRHPQSSVIARYGRVAELL